MLVCIGCLNADLVARVPVLPGADGRVMSTGFTRSLGGMAANVAVAARAAGAAAVELVAAIGPDDTGRWLESELGRRGVGTRWLDRASLECSVTCLILVPPGGERAIISEPSALAVAHVGRALSEAGAPGHAHVDGFHAASVSTLLGEARTAGWTTSIDLDELPSAHLASVPFRQLCGSFDIVFVNSANAVRVCGEATASDWCDSLAQHAATTTTTFALTLGADGACVIEPSGAVTRMDGIEVDSVDTTGAGDVFAATLLVNHLAGMPISKAASHANQAAALSTTVPGPGGRRRNMRENHG